MVKLASSGVGWVGGGLATDSRFNHQTVTTSNSNRMTAVARVAVERWVRLTVLIKADQDHEPG
jgi:hypothetical protein